MGGPHGRRGPLWAFARWARLLSCCRSPRGSPEDPSVCQVVPSPTKVEASPSPARCPPRGWKHDHGGAQDWSRRTCTGVVVSHVCIFRRGVVGTYLRRAGSGRDRFAAKASACRPGDDAFPSKHDLVCRTNPLRRPWPTRMREAGSGVRRLALLAIAHGPWPGDEAVAEQQVGAEGFTGEAGRYCLHLNEGRARDRMSGTPIDRQCERDARAARSHSRTISRLASSRASASVIRRNTDEDHTSIRRHAARGQHREDG